MRYLYACFKNYIGFYNGMGIDKLEIDFTKCKNNIVLINGINGCGKSTLLNSLSPFPDSSSAFMPNKDAEKILTLIDSNDTYNIKIVSPADSKGGRKQSKAFISKNGLELNENGNITSYKEIIFSEFELDSNYSSLTKLSSTDRGLGDKTPAERKKFASSIVDNLETYNDIYKTLNKKSLIFKSHINTIHTKIQNIGNKENLEMTLNNMRARAEEISSRVLFLNNSIVELQTRTSINQEEMEQIQSIKEEEAVLSNKLNFYKNEYLLSKRKCQVEESEIEDKYTSDLNLLNEYDKKKEISVTEWKAESGKLSLLNSSLNDVRANIEIYSSGFDTSLENRYKETKNNIDNLMISVNKLNIPTDTSLIYKLDTLINLYYRLIKKIDSFIDGLDMDDLRYISLEYDPDTINRLNNSIVALNNESITLREELASINEKLKTISILEYRPKNCKIDSCSFVSDALSIIKSESEESLIKRSKDIQDRLDTIELNIIELNKCIEKHSYLNSKSNDFKSIINDINDNNEIISLFGEDYLRYEESFREAIAYGNTFNEIRDPRRLIDGLNLLKELEKELDTFKILEVEYSSMKNNMKVLNKNKEMETKLSAEIKELLETISKLKSNIDNFDSLISSLNNIINSEKVYLDNYKEYLEVLKKYNEVKEKIDKIDSKSSDSSKNIIKINEYRQEIDKLNLELNPINNDINRLSAQLNMLDSYYQEYNLYESKYNMIETLKKYCSPTGGGIQTIFMQLYMSKTLDLANQVLGMLFAGEYRLLDFVINQNEFRIPFVGSGLTVDDISSGSTSQICIMSMAINLALFYQASTKFNIARLDELDSGLDSYNRYEFVNALYNMLPLLNIEQLFIISHSIEADASRVDIIKLKSYSDFDNQAYSGNIIYDYSKDIKH